MKHGDSLQKLVRICGTQKRLAQILGLSETQVSRINRGKSREVEYLTIIAELLEAIPPGDRPSRWKQEERKNAGKPE